MDRVMTPPRPAGTRRPARLRAVLGIGLATMVLGTVGCGSRAPKAAGLTFDLAVEPNPPRVGSATMTTRVTGEDGKPVTGATLKLEGNMNHAGMVPVFSRPEESAPGTYVGDLEFTMGGDWYIEITGSLADGRRLEHRVDVKGVLAE